ncbi:hypothetical protein SAMN05421806_119117 [Streptomyces indicus]|uniref:Uncharacterized protein n=1 Tax=Streptomyces indicus TaxID=417292 RepID=A0A1G9HNX1_9ACTN|nr:hypothetical protein SAMN05421806_119117 [Streptomyces indicus]
MTGQTVVVKAWRNRLTLGETGIQLRHGPDNRWHPYAHEDGARWPCAPADPTRSPHSPQPGNTAATTKAGRDEP